MLLVLIKTKKHIVYVRELYYSEPTLCSQGHLASVLVLETGHVTFIDVFNFPCLSFHIYKAVIVTVLSCAIVSKTK